MLQGGDSSTFQKESIMATAKKAPAKKAAPAKTAAGVKATGKTAAKGSPAKSATTRKPASKAAAPAKKRIPNPAFMKALTLSPELSAVVGDKPLPRTEIVSKLWVYIKANNLQDQKNKRMINADTKLLAVFGKPQVSMFEMAGLIGKHVK